MSTAEVIDDLSGIAEIEADWRKLAAGRGNAFITPEWYRAWFEHYGSGHTPLVVVSRRSDGSIEGIVPLVARADARVKHLRFAGANLGDYFELAARVEDEDRVAATAAQALSDRYGDRYLLTLDRVDVAATWPALFARGENKKRRMTKIGCEAVLPFLCIRGMTWNDYLSNCSSHARRVLRSKRSALEKKHNSRFRKSVDPSEVEKDMDTLFDLHDRRWNTRGGSSLTSLVARAFLKDFAARALENEWLRLAFLEIDDVPVAAEFAWHLGPRFSCYQAGFDPVWCHRSVGYLLRMHSLENAIAEGADDFDLLLGEEEHKARLTTIRRSVRTIVIAPSMHPVQLLVMSDCWLHRAARIVPCRIRQRMKPAGSRLLRWLPTSRMR